MLFALRASSANALEKSLVVVGSINMFMGGYSHFVHLGIISDDPSYSEMPEPYQTYRIDRIFRISKMQLASHSKRSS